MRKEDAYRKLTNKLKDSEVEFHGKQKVKQNVINHLSNNRSQNKLILRSFYDLSEVKWLRWSISAAAVLFIGIFFSQQVLISKRIDNLEKQIVQTENSVQPRVEAISTSHRMILNLITDQNLDSVTVSKSDLDALFKEYADMQKNIEDLRKGIDIKSLIHSKNDESNSSKMNQNL
jgi:hypothetical protein